MPNATLPPEDVVVPTLANMIEILGSQAAPVENITIRGLTFTANRPTFMESRSNPSGGDWSLERFTHSQCFKPKPKPKHKHKHEPKHEPKPKPKLKPNWRLGAVFLEGTVSCTIKSNTFIRLDSNAVFLSGFNKNTAITRNDFRWLGQNAIASWGRAVDYDGTNGEFPRYTLIEGNFIHEIGHIQKQSSFYFQAETAEASIKNNICFNIPRAAVNFNDGFGGRFVWSSLLLTLILTPN